jgi:hypothetical protein
MSRKRGVLSGRTCKILALSLALVALAVALPTAVLASSEETETALSGPQPAADRHPSRGRLYSSSPQSASSGSDLQLSTLGPLLFSDDVESGTGSWTATGTWAITTEWVPPWADPGNHSWSDSPSGNYANGTDSSLTSGVIDLSAAAPGQDVILGFDVSYDLQGGDYLDVEFSADGGTNWDYYGDRLTGTSDGWFETYVPAAMFTNQFKFRFRLVTDISGTADGVHIDWVEATDPRLAYYGSWATATRPFPEGGTWTYKSSSTPGDLVQIEFNGPAIWWTGKMGPNCGIVSASLDGGPALEMDYYWDPAWGSGYNSYPMGITGFDGLTDGPHTLTLSCTGTKQPASTGYAVSLESLSVWGALTSATGPTRYQQEDTNLARVGNWYTSTTWSASNGSFASVDGPGSAMNVTFDGTYLAWYAKKGPGYGKALVTLDAGTSDEVTTTVDLYSSYDRYKQRVYSTGLLTDGAHTLSIYWIGQKNSRAWGTKIDVDAFDILGTLTPAPTPPPILWRYQQNDSRVTYLGPWTSASTWSASGGSLYSTATTGAAALVNFKGPEVKLFAKTAPWYGQARVALDGDWATAELVDFYSPTTLYKQPVYTKTGLSPGAHTLAIKCIGEKNLASTGLSISLDAIDTGYLTQAPQTTRFQQDNAAIAYTGAWTPSAITWSASGGSYITANATGAQVTVNFTGSYLAWVAKTAPWYGKAQLKLDGGPAFQVDLYSATTGWKKQVYNTGLLTAGPHTLSIQWLGTKNTRSGGTTISVDAFDILGTI